MSIGNISDSRWVVKYLEKSLFFVCLSGLLFVIVSNVGKWHLMLLPGFEKVHIEGNFLHVDRFEVESIIGETLQADFFDLDIRKLETELEAIEWIARVDIGQIWPNALQVSIYEHQAIAHWNNNSLISESGHVFQPGNTQNLNLPVFYSELDRPQAVLDIYHHALAQLKTIGIGIQGLYEDRRQTTRMLLSNNNLLVLGRDKHKEKISRFIQAYGHIENDFSNQEICVDLRHAHGFAVNPQAKECYQGGL